MFGINSIERLLKVVNITIKTNDAFQKELILTCCLDHFCCLLGCHLLHRRSPARCCSTTNSVACNFSTAESRVSVPHEVQMSRWNCKIRKSFNKTGYCSNHHLPDWNSFPCSNNHDQIAAFTFCDHFILHSIWQLTTLVLQYTTHSKRK